jgi:hypothetical protein
MPDARAGKKPGVGRLEVKIRAVSAVYNERPQRIRRFRRRKDAFFTKLRVKGASPRLIHPVTAALNAGAKDGGHNFRLGSPRAHDLKRVKNDARSPPAGMKDGNSAAFGIQQKNRQTVGDGDGKKRGAGKTNHAVPVRRRIIINNNDIAGMNLLKAADLFGGYPPLTEKRLKRGRIIASFTGGDKAGRRGHPCRRNNRFTIKHKGKRSRA